MYLITICGVPRCVVNEAYPALDLHGLCSARNLSVIEESAARLFARWPQGRVHIEPRSCPVVTPGEW